MMGENEGMDGATLDIPKPLTQTKVDNEEDKVTIRLRRKLAKYLVLIALEIYSPYVVINK